MRLFVVALLLNKKHNKNKQKIPFNEYLRLLFSFLKKNYTKKRREIHLKTKPILPD